MISPELQAQNSGGYRGRRAVLAKVCHLGPCYGDPWTENIPILTRTAYRYCAHLNGDYVAYLLSEDQAIYHELL